ncbi:MAG: hypothetical protein QHH01_06280, partial [Spirochaetales bacterium]|nr:hypothetical protein [Spirochaetales bacterium]
PWYPACICPTCASALQQIAPPLCRICGRELVSEHEICINCRENPIDLACIRPLFMYRGMVVQLMHAYKKDGRRSLARFWAFLLGQFIAQSTDLKGLPLVPVPPRPERITKGGFDQIGLICTILAGEQGVRILPILERRSQGQEQKLLKRQERWENALTAYTIKKGRTDRVHPSKVVLLDDVVTTGATLSGCTAVLQQYGIQVAAGIVIAAD